MLERLEKISKIIFAGVASTVIAIAGLGIDWKRVGLEQDSWCFEHSDRADAALLRKTEFVPQILIDRFSKRCNVSTSEATRVMQEDKVLAELSESPPKPIEKPPEQEHKLAFDGFVALGKKQPTQYSQVNFNFAEDGKPSIHDGTPPPPGAILKARWSVNMRENTTVTTGGQNPIVLVIAAGECLTIISEPQELRNQFWASVKQTECE